MVCLMPEIDGKITHVSDTAFMVAACRAHENELEDAFVHDPFAARLAGERGVAILRELPYSNLLRLGLAIRTVSCMSCCWTRSQHTRSRLCSASAAAWTPARGASTLSPDLRWIEIDFADVLDYKDRLLSGERSRCRRERLTVGLNNAAQRRAMYEAAGSSSALMITEGLMLYLPAATVDALAAEASIHSGVAHWISDITTSAFSKVLGGGADTMQPIRHVQASDALKGEEILEVLQRHGWTTSAMRSYISDVDFVRERVKRAMGGATPPQRPYPPNDPTGVHRFARGQ